MEKHWWQAEQSISWETLGHCKTSLLEEPLSLHLLFQTFFVYIAVFCILSSFQKQGMLPVISLPNARNVHIWIQPLHMCACVCFLSTLGKFLMAIVFGVSPPQACSRKLYNWLRVAPYRPDQQVEEDDDFMEENQGKGIRVLGIAFSSAR